MENMTMKVDGNVLTITIDLTKTLWQSQWTELIAKTNNVELIPGRSEGITLAVYRNKVRQPRFQRT
jgi:hypothetical protein